MKPKTKEEYFFKESIYKYPMEFWSEIAASKVGATLGFNVLDYNVGIHDNTVGCISKSMIDDFEDLVPGINILFETIPDFQISNRPKYSFQDVESAFLNDPHSTEYIEKMIDISIFDAIIGNQDRHLENWALIRRIDFDPERLTLKNMFLDICGYILSKIRHPREEDPHLIRTAPTISHRFSPLYDNGSSLGREMDETQVSVLIQDPARLQQYLDRGRHEIRWDKKRVSFMDLLHNLRSSYETYFLARLENIIKQFDPHQIEEIVGGIDHDIPQEFANIRLTANRKQMMTAMMCKRIIDLKENLI